MSMPTRKADLLATINEQKEKLDKYQLKIQDVVRAYKGLLKEKEALQASFAAISNRPILRTDTKDDTEADTSEAGSSQDSKSEDVNNSLEEKVSTLTRSLQTLTEEKSKLEVSTTSERKRILEEKKQIEHQFKIESESRVREKKEFETRKQDMSSRIIVLQHEADKETTNGLMMLREVENNLSKERRERERVERTLDECQEQNRQLMTSLAPSREPRGANNKLQKQVLDLSNELEQVRGRLRKAEKETGDNSPAMREMRERMRQMKHEYDQAVAQEQEQSASASAAWRSASAWQEARVAALEAAVADAAAASAGAQHRADRQHNAQIRQFKDHIMELTDENLDLRKNESNLILPERQKSDGSSLARAFDQLWRKRSDIREKDPIAYNTFKECVERSEELHESCAEERSNLNNEIRRLKENIESSPSSSQCNCGLASQIAELRDRVRELQHQKANATRQHLSEVESLNKELEMCRSATAEAARRHETSLASASAVLHQQLASQTRMSLTAIREKESQMEGLVKQVKQMTQQMIQQTQPSTVAAALLSHVGAVGGTDGPSLLHLEDSARRQIETNQLRREKVQLDREVRDLQKRLSDFILNRDAHIRKLENEIKRLNVNSNRSGSNLEYLKNVVVQFMTSKEIASKKPILKAIAAVLHFTPEEAQAANESLS